MMAEGVCGRAQVLGACLRDRASCCLIMELAEGGNLHQRIHDPVRGRMSLLETLQVPFLPAEHRCHTQP